MVHLRISRPVLRLQLVLVLLGSATIFACILPGRLVDTVSRSGEVSTPSPTISPTATGKTESTALSSQESPTISPETVTSEALAPEYPQPGLTQDSRMTEYPQLSTGVTTSPVPSVTSTPESTRVSQTPIQTEASSGSSYPPPPVPVNPYPGLQPEFPPNVPYPNPPGPYPTSPELGSKQTATSTTKPVLSKTAITTPSPSSAAFSPSPTFYSLAPSTQTSTPTPTRYLTPTPTMTFTPTPTRTPLPAPPWMNVQIQATDPETVELAAGKPQLIEFFAYWSGPSLAMAPIVKGVEDEYAYRMNFIYLDIDDPGTEALKEQFHFRNEPFFVLIDGEGNVLKEWVGYVSVDQFRTAIDTALR